MAGLRWDDVERRLGGLADRPVRRLSLEGPAAAFGRSAVLLLLGPVAGVPSLVLTRRGAGLRQDGGLIALPGGHVDEGESVEAAALREAEEELGIDPAVVQLAGRLDDAWSKYGTVVGSVVGSCAVLPDLRPAPGGPPPPAASPSWRPSTAAAAPDRLGSESPGGRAIRCPNCVRGPKPGP